jgi:hypothetical protein
MRPTPRDDAVLIGWQGESYTESLTFGDYEDATKKPRLEQISEHPRAYVYHNFLSDKEVDHILQVGIKPFNTGRLCLLVPSVYLAQTTKLLIYRWRRQG